MHSFALGSMLKAGFSRFTVAQRSWEHFGKYRMGFKFFFKTAVKRKILSQYKSEPNLI
jgi:hypothetical protein